jgi:hypothetical protein
MQRKRGYSDRCGNRSQRAPLVQNHQIPEPQLDLFCTRMRRIRVRCRENDHKLLTSEAAHDVFCPNTLA